jgi:hypothetical protein
MGPPDGFKALPGQGSREGRPVTQAGWVGCAARPAGNAVDLDPVTGGIAAMAIP